MSVNRSIPAMYQGVSQQPAALRALEQCQALENGYPTVADGERKRPPTEFVAFGAGITPDSAKVHHYFRGDGEHNIVFAYHDVGAGTGGLRVFDGETGNERTVDTSTYPGVLDYLDTLDPIDDIGCLTVADTTFLWNRTKTTAMSATVTAAQTPRLFVYVKEGLANTQYSITIPAGTATYDPGDTSLNRQTTNIAEQLRTQIDVMAGYTATRFGNLVVIVKDDSTDFTFKLTDSAGDSAMYGFKNRVERYSDLPRQFVEGATVEVRGQGDSAKSSYWVKFVNDASGQIGHWEETVAPIAGQHTEFDATTMPLELVRQADGTFLLKRVDWNLRLVGSTDVGSVPAPSFVGGTVSAMFFARGRLGILSGENVVMSRANSLFNFWPKSVAVVSDDDPIDVTVSSPRVANLRHACPFQRTLMLFSDNAQFPLTGGEVLSPKNVRLDPATEFDCSSLVSPVSSGQDLFFVFERASSGATYSGVREYFVNQNSVTNDAVDVTAHIPQYIPRNVHWASVSSTEDLLLLLTKDEWNAVYFYKYLWDGDKKAQSAWGKWTFRPSDKILSAAIDKTTVYFLIQRVDGLYLERMNLQSTATTGTLPYVIHLDTLALDDRSGLPPFYDTILDETTLWKPYDLPAPEGELMVVAGPDFPSGAGSVLPIVGTQGSTGVKVKGNWTAHPCYMGRVYEHRHTISEQFMRDAQNAAIQQGRLQLKYLTVNFKNAVTFKLEVATPGRDTSVYKYSALLLGIIGSLIGSPVMRSGTYTFPVASKSDRCTLTLVNDSPYPATFYSCEWEGEFTTRSARR